MAKGQQTSGARKRKMEVTDLDLVRSGLDDEYEILEELGRGGMGIVYRARERQLEREVAIKVLPFTLAFDRELVERFLREARTAAGLEHPHIVPIYRVGRRGDVIFFVMKLLRGVSLSDRLRDSGRLPAGEIRRTLLETAAALGYAHRRGVVHRDIKPDNLRFDEDGRCVVTDFGIARSAGSTRLTTTGMSVGTPKYMSPEQARAKDVDGRSDIYSLGIVAYECIAGAPPFDAGDALGTLMKHIQSPLPTPALDGAEDAALYAVVERMLAKHADDRFVDTDELIRTLGGDVGPATGQSRAWTMPTASAATERSPSPNEPTVPLARRGGTQRTATSSGPRGATYDPRSDAMRGDLPPLDEGPAPSPALDAALDASVAMLRRQGPKMDAVAAAAKRYASGVGPVGARVMALLASIGRAVAGMGRRVGLTMQRATDAALAFLAKHTGGSGARLQAKLSGRTSTVWMASAWAIALFVLAVTAFRATTGSSAGHSDSRCPIKPAMDGRYPYAVLLDPITDQARGANMPLTYDVCGLEKGVEFVAKVTIARPGARKASEKVVQSFTELAAGLGTRLHRSMSLGTLANGVYKVTVMVTDDRGRRRDAVEDFAIVGAK